MMQNSTFGQKLGAGFAAVAALALLMGGVGLYALQVVVAGKDQVILHAGQDLIDAERMRTALQREESNNRGFLLTGEQRFADGARSANQEFGAVVASIRGRGASPEVEKLLTAIAAAEDEHQRVSDEVMEGRRTGTDPVQAAGRFDERVVPKFDALRDHVLSLSAEAEREST